MDVTYNIMFVDDEPSILDGIRRSLRRYLNLGVSLSFFRDGKSALKAIEESPPDILVTDMRMPHMSGGDLLQTVHQRFPSVRTFILSGHCQQSEALNLVKSHDHFLRKPFNSKDLVKLLKLDERRKNQTDLIVAPELPASAEVEGRDEQKEKVSIDIPDWEENPLAPARGIVFGVLFSIPLWMAILLIVQWLFISDHG